MAAAAVGLVLLPSGKIAAEQIPDGAERWSPAAVRQAWHELEARVGAMGAQAGVQGPQTVYPVGRGAMLVRGPEPARRLLGQFIGLGIEFAHQQLDRGAPHRRGLDRRAEQRLGECVAQHHHIIRAAHLLVVDERAAG